VLVTHQLQYLKGIKHVVVMSAGQIKAQGSYDYIRNNENDLSSFYDFKKSIEADDVDDGYNYGGDNNYNEVSKYY
jgi:ABC-type methionine transport system ATPase subunit